MLDKDVEYFEDSQANHFLRTLKVSLSDVHSALENGVLGFYSATETHPRNTAGTRQWQDTVKTLRDNLQLKGWHKPTRSEDAYSEILSLDGKWRLVVWTGDKYTGLLDSDRTPKSKNGKGGGISFLIQSNSQQSLPLVDTNTRKKEKTIKTIALIFYFDKQSGEVRSELSMPIGTEFDWSKDQPFVKPKVDKFDWRIIFSPFKVSDSDSPISDRSNDTAVFTDEIDIAIDSK